jgi:thymidylate synthase
MQAYLDILQHVLDEGQWKETRTGVRTLATFGYQFEHDMSDGFPLGTTRRLPIKSTWVELTGFLNGITDKQWYLDNDCHFWDYWCRPDLVPEGLSREEANAVKREENDLGPIYGWVWLHEGAEYVDQHTDYTGQGSNQLERMTEIVRTNPEDRQNVVTAWNSTYLDQQALPPCHWGFQVDAIGDELHLAWQQRSVDTPIGLPANIASYATILYILAREAGLKPGKLVGQLGDVHIYEDQLDGVEKQLKREPRELPRIETDDSVRGLLDWDFTKSKLVGYEPHSRIKYPRPAV